MNAVSPILHAPECQTRREKYSRPKARGDTLESITSVATTTATRADHTGPDRPEKEEEENLRPPFGHDLLPILAKAAASPKSITLVSSVSVLVPREEALGG